MFHRAKTLANFGDLSMTTRTDISTAKAILIDGKKCCGNCKWLTHLSDGIICGVCDCPYDDVNERYARKDSSICEFWEFGRANT